MARLAQYMQSLAALLGHESAVHFDGLRPGSTCLATKIDYEDVPKVEKRLKLVKRGEGAPDAVRARVEIDNLLAEDNATGFVYENDDVNAEVIVFPGVTRPKPTTFGPFNQEGSIDGILISVSGADQTVHVQLQNAEIKYTGIDTNRENARRLAKHMYEPVRVTGVGRWLRDEDGNWILKKFRMDTFVALADDDLKGTIDQLRRIEGSEWKEMEDPLRALTALREKGNGIH